MKSKLITLQKWFDMFCSHSFVLGTIEKNSFVLLNSPFGQQIPNSSLNNGSFPSTLRLVVKTCITLHILMIIGRIWWPKYQTHFTQHTLLAQVYIWIYDLLCQFLYQSKVSSLSFLGQTCHLQWNRRECLRYKLEEVRHWGSLWFHLPLF